MRRLLAAVAVVVVLAGVAGVLVYDSTRSDRVADGVSVAGVDVGGRSVEQARRVVAERVARPAQRDVVVRRGERTFELAAGDAGVEVDVERTVEAAVDAGRRGNPWSRTWRALTGGEVDADVEPRMTFDGDAVDEFVERVAGELDREPRDAEVEVGDGRLETIEAREGFETYTDELRERVARALERPRGERELQAPGATPDPDVTTAELRERHPLFLVVDRDGFRLRVYESLELDATYRIGVGQAGHNTPAGRYDISNKAVNPTWYVPDEPWAGERRGEEIPPGPDNPIKSRWLGIEDGIGIHGTDQPESIGTRASHGCIRMLIPEVEELYERVPVGTPVHID